MLSSGDTLIHIATNARRAPRRACVLRRSIKVFLVGVRPVNDGNNYIRNNNNNNGNNTTHEKKTFPLRKEKICIFPKTEKNKTKLVAFLFLWKLSWTIQKFFRPAGAQYSNWTQVLKWQTSRRKKEKDFFAGNSVARIPEGRKSKHVYTCIRPMYGPS